MTLKLYQFVHDDCQGAYEAGKMAGPPLFVLWEGASVPPGFCDYILKILRQFLLNSAAVFVKFCDNISPPKHPKSTEILT